MKTGRVSTNPEESFNGVLKEDINKQWGTPAGDCYEFLQTHDMDIELAEDPVYDPWVTVRVWQGATGMFSADKMVGEVLRHPFFLGPRFEIFFWCDSSRSWKSYGLQFCVERRILAEI